MYTVPFWLTLFLSQSLIWSVCWPLLPFNLSNHLGVEGVVERGGQWAEWRRQHHGLLGLRLSLVDVEDLATLGVALGGCDQTPQPGRQHRGGGPVGRFTLCYRNCICSRVLYRSFQYSYLQTSWQFIMFNYCFHVAIKSLLCSTVVSV